MAYRLAPFRPFARLSLWGVLLLSLTAAPFVQARTTITVSTTADDTTVNGNCTLREALIAANTDTAVDACPAGNGADTILLSGATYTLTIPGTIEDAAATGDLDVTSTVTIRGTGASTTIIQAGTSNPVTGACSSCVDRVFDVRGGGALTVERATIRHGSLTSADGGGVRVIAGSTLTIDRGVITNNLIDSSSGEGGGIFNQGGTVTIRSSTVSGNKSNQDRGGGLKNTGAGAMMHIENSTVSGNTAADAGGGIHTASGATLTMISTTISGNTAGGDGGGVHATSATLTITKSTLSGNASGDDGGGIFLSSGTHTITNSTLSGNTATSNGGGIYDASSSNTITLNNTTLAINKAGDGASAALRINTSGTAMTLNNSILTGNVSLGGGPATECNSASAINGTHNLIDDTSCGSSHRLGAIDAAAFSYTLSNNGGATATHAINNQNTPTDGVEDGSGAACSAAGITTDQRGTARNGTCDVGAFEAPLPPPSPGGSAPITISGTSGLGNDAGWRMMAPPASGLTRADINGITFTSSSGSGNDMLRRYDESAGSGSARWLNTTNAGSLSQGLGFILYLFDDATDPIDPSLTISFAGAHETTTSVTTPSLDTNESLHLLGNPFFTGFDLNSLNLIPQGFQATVQVWDPTAGGGTGSFRSFTQGSGGSVLARGQGFFAQRTTPGAGTTTLTFDSAGRVSGGTFIGKTRHSLSAGSRIGLALTGQSTSGLVVHDEAATVLFREGARIGWDAYEVSKLVPLTDQYATVSLVGERQGEPIALAVASYPAVLSQPLDIPLQLEGRAFAGELTLAWPVWDAIPSSWNLVLVDYERGKRVDMRQTHTYTFAYEAPGDKTLSLHNMLAPSLQMAPAQGQHRFAIEINPLSATPYEKTPTVPAAFLAQNYPNPFATETTIRYSLATAGPVRLFVYDLLGREVARLVDEWQPSGAHTAQMDGASLAPGAYVYVLQAGAQRLHRAMLHVK